ncbi:MAG TPA: transporter [Candidatus Nitrosotenuis sp.]|nr:transporter [Candidatus Nitrosotenuis sp.]
MRFFALLVVLWLFPNVGFSQSSTGQPSPMPSQPKPALDIADNSFLLEEAYNQEFGVVQHISAFTKNWNNRAWFYSFTQEWPINPAPRNQFSYTLLAVSSSMPGVKSGLGDLLINWRYQLVGDVDASIAFSPRVSLLLPTGDSRKGRGEGSFGVQVNLPLSVKHHPKLVTHWNAGATFVPRAKNEFDQRAATYGVNLGQSFIWKVRPSFNWMLETVFESSESVLGPGAKQRDNTLIMNPGFRWAHNFENGLQIVPGISFPVIAAGSGRGNGGFLLYVSFEHPFAKEKR